MCPIFRFSGPNGGPKQAHAVWQWFNCCAARVPEGKAPLRFNLDETSVCLFQGGGKGTIIFKKRRDPPATEPHESAPRAKRRTCLTHVAFICDRSDIQPLLPQVVVGNEATLKAGDLARLIAACPPNVQLVRQKSAWNNMRLMVQIINMLASALRPHMDRFQPFLLLDASRVHLHPEVFYRSLALKIWPIVVPAKLTWLLQPCDTHLFQKYKADLQRAYQACRLDAGSRELEVEDFLTCMWSAIRRVFQGTVWDVAFDGDGFGHNQQRLSTYIQRQLQMTEPLALPAGVPSEDMLKLCFPRGAKVPYRALMRPLEPAPSPAAIAAAPVGHRMARRILPASFGKAAPAVPKLLALPSSRMPVAKALAGREPRTRSEHRLREALAKGRAETE